MAGRLIPLVRRSHGAPELRCAMLRVDEPTGAVFRGATPLDVSSRELALLRQAAGGVAARDLEPMLAAAGAALPDGRLPTGIEYTPGELRLRGLDMNSDEEMALLARLQTSGYQARPEDGSLLLRTEGNP